MFVRFTACIALLPGSAFEKFGAAMEQQQEVLAGTADVAMEVFAMESVPI